jgi:inositol 1,4,5-triphosphate receptor type 1
MPLLKIAPEDCDTKSEDFQLLVSQLLLFGKMCQGNNKECIEALSKHVTFEQAIWCVHHCCHSGQRLHPSLVSKYVELIKVMFVDVGDNRDMLENLSYSFVYEEIVEKPYKDARSDPYKALTGVVNEHFPKMNEWISHYLHAIKKTIEGEEDKFIGNELSQETKLQEMIEAHYHQLAKVLEVLSLLTKYGYYVAEGDVTKVLEPLFCILQSKPKVDEKSKEKGDHKEPFEELKSTVRERAIEVLELLFNFRFYVHLQRFIFDFRQLQDPNAGVLRSLMEVHETEDLHRPSLIYAARDQLRELFSESKFGFESDSTPDSFAETLIELSSCNCHKLVQRSLHLLNRHFSAETTLFQRAVQTQLLTTEESKKVFEDIEKQLPTLRRYLSVDLSDDTSTKVVKILKSFTAMCQLSVGDNQPCTTHIYPHTQNQKILYNIGVFSCILDYVLEIAMEPPESVTCALRDVCMECFRFLRMLARNNSKVQKRLYEQMDILLEIKVAVPNMVMAMVEAFTNHADNCLRVKEQQVEKIFQLVTASDEARPELIDLLQVIIKLEDIDLPVERTENMIMKYFNKSWGSFCSNLLGEGMVKVREEVLMKVEEHKDLQLLLSITDLLASCAEGENLFVESTCQSIFKVEELLHILCNCEISPERKRPFAQFLINVYFNTDEEDDHSEICSLTTDRDMWRYLEHISVLVENIRIALQAIPDTEHQKVCDALLPQCRSTSQEKQTTKIPAIRTTSRTIEYVTLDGGELKPGILLYFMDGVLPLVHYFYAKCPDSTFKQTEDRIEKLLRITDLLLKNLLELCDTLMLYLTTDVQVKLYRSTVVSVLHYATPSVKETEVRFFPSAIIPSCLWLLGCHGVR